MFFLNVAQSEPPGPQFSWNLIFTLSDSFYINLSFFGFVLLGKKKNDTTVFAIISPLKMTWPFLYKVEFPLCKDDLYQVWMKFASWFWRRRILQICFSINTFVRQACTSMCNRTKLMIRSWNLFWYVT
jgi:hypothetical protein